MNPELKTEELYLELERLGAILGVPVPQCRLTIETFDKNGNRTSFHKQRSHSWTRNAYNVMFGQLAAKDISDSTFGAGLLSIKPTSGVVAYGALPVHMGNINTTGALYTLDSVSATAGGYRGPASNSDYGIQVGTGVGAESFEDYVIGTLIATGNGAGELAYGEQEAPSVSYTAGTKTLSNALIRYFNNNSGGSITVTEVSLLVNGYAQNEIAKWMMARDKLASGVAVADTGQLKVTYTISLVYAG